MLRLPILPTLLPQPQRRLFLVAEGVLRLDPNLMIG
jgi:hypothetical protein